MMMNPAAESTPFFFGSLGRERVDATEILLARPAVHCQLCVHFFFGTHLLSLFGQILTHLIVPKMQCFPINVAPSRSKLSKIEAVAHLHAAMTIHWVTQKVFLTCLSLK